MGAGVAADDAAAAGFLGVTACTGLASAFRTGFESGFDTALTADLTASMTTGLTPGLKAGLPIGLATCLALGLATGLPTGLATGLEEALAVDLTGTLDLTGGCFAAGLEICFFTTTLATGLATFLTGGCTTRLGLDLTAVFGLAAAFGADLATVFPVGLTTGLAGGLGAFLAIADEALTLLLALPDFSTFAFTACLLWEAAYG